MIIITISCIIIIIVIIIGSHWLDTIGLLVWLFIDNMFPWDLSGDLLINYYREFIIGSLFH